MLAIMTVVAPWRAVRTDAQPGQATGQSLDKLSGDEFDRAFLVRMGMHHAMAVAMSCPVVANAAHQETKDLGGSVIASQSAEIAQMNAWLAAW
ncbi:MAG: DUF305 domain-containing protein [Chloroflexi bacterium]|nr:DUF305 domain-containing protein [Chloroflexota bacterium]